MRTYGRVWDDDGNPSWHVVETDAAGFNDYVYASALCQCLQLNLGESPFWADFGLPAHQAIIQQVAPDYNVQFIATYFSRFFASLIISRSPIEAPAGTFRVKPQNPRNTAATGPAVAYYIQALRFDGSLFQAEVAI